MHPLAEAVLGVRAEPQSLTAYTGTVQSVQGSTVAGVYTVRSVSVLLKGSTSPIIIRGSGAFTAEVIAADGNLNGREVLVLVIDSQPVVLTTIGVS